MKAMSDGPTKDALIRQMTTLEARKEASDGTLEVRVRTGVRVRTRVRVRTGVRAKVRL